MLTVSKDFSEFSYNITSDLCFLIFWPQVMWDLSSQSDVEPAPPALRIPKYWTTWEVPAFLLLRKNTSHDRNSYLTID